MIGWLKKLHHWSWIWLDGNCWIIICRRKSSFHICELGLKGECWRVTDWYVKRMQLKHKPVTNCNLGSINYVCFNYKVNLLIGREKILQHYVPIPWATSVTSSLFAPNQSPNYPWTELCTFEGSSELWPKAYQSAFFINQHRNVNWWNKIRIIGLIIWIYYIWKKNMKRIFFHLRGNCIVLNIFKNHPVFHKMMPCCLSNLPTKWNMVYTNSQIKAFTTHLWYNWGFPKFFPNR